MCACRSVRFGRHSAVAEKSGRAWRIHICRCLQNLISAVASNAPFSNSPFSSVIIRKQREKALSRVGCVPNPCLPPSSV